MKKTSLWFCAAISLFAAGSAQADLTLNPGSSQANERFYVGGDRAFIGQSYDMTGVGNSNFNDNSGNSSWLTMISPSYFITSRHFHPISDAEASPNPGQVPLFRPNVAPFTNIPYGGRVLSYTQVGTTDMYIGQLSAPVPASVAKYALLPASTSLVGKDLYVVGQGSTGSRLGLNAFARVMNGQTDGSSVGDAFEYDFNTAGGYGNSEALLNDGDSGAPTFVPANGQFALVGLHWYKDTSGSISKSGDTYVSKYITQIQSIVALGGESITVVPEPASGMLLLALPAALLRRRRQLA